MPLYIPARRLLLGKNPEEKVSLISGLECTWNDNVAAWIKVKSLLHFTAVCEGARGTITVVVVHPFLGQLATAIIWGLGVSEKAM